MKLKLAQFAKLTFIVLATILSVESTHSQTIVGYTMSSNGNATSGIAVNYPGMGRTIGINDLTSSSYSVSFGQTCYGWGNAVGTDSWSTSAFSTAQYINLTGSFQMKGNTNFGPKEFKVQYSLNGSAWNDTPTGSLIFLNNGFSTFNFSLPTVCENKSTVYVRWVLNSTSRLDGGTLSSTTSTHNASLKGVSIAGNLFAAPSTQASNISISSGTPTSLNVSCTNGNGNHRIIVMNTVNSFTNPVNDYNPSANTNYAGGEQVIYNGTESAVTVNVPSSSNEYWFRVYEYNKMDNLTRYNTSTASFNPKQCKLEAIHTPTSTNIRLTRADLGATITTPTSGTIVERGIYWSTTTPVDETANLVSESTNLGGVYSIADIPVDRGTTIYFKGYVTNEYGTNMSEEGSFTNKPVFSGTGNWEDNTKWNVKEVPGSHGDPTYGDVTDSPTIDGLCTLDNSNEVTDLTINNGKKLTINPEKTLDVKGTLTNGAADAGILIKTSDTKANGSLHFANGNPHGSVEMYSKAYINLGNPPGSKYNWQFFGIPVKTFSAGEINSCESYIREWDESVSDYNKVWVERDDHTSLYVQPSDIMTHHKGYELVQCNPRTITFHGELVDTDLHKSLSYTPGAAFPGQNIYGNPYTAGIDISKISFGPNTEQAVYLYNTGTYNDWLGAGGDSSPGNGPGQYTVSTPGTAGHGGVQADIPSMQGFLVKATGAGSTIDISKSTGLMSNTSRQKVKGLSANNVLTNTRVDLIGEHFSDRMWIFSNPNCTRSFDNGWDGKKMLGNTQVSQLYSIENDGIYQINAVNDMNESYIGFQPGIDTNFKLVFNHENTSSIYAGIYLVDLFANKTVDISQSGSEYSFTASPTDVTKRFKIITQPTGLVVPSDNQNSKLRIFDTEEGIYVENFSNNSATFVLCNVAGKIMQEITINENSTKTISTKNLTPGVYIAKSETDSEKLIQRFIIK